MFDCVGVNVMRVKINLYDKAGQKKAQKPNIKQRNDFNINKVLRAVGQYLGFNSFRK